MRRTKVINQILYILLLIPLMKPESFNQVPMLDMIFNVLMVVSSLIILLLYISENNKIDYFIIILIGYLGISLVSTLINDGSVYICVVRITSIIDIVLFIKLLINKDPVLLFNTLLPVIEVLLCLNLLTIFLFPEGMYTIIVEGIGYTKSANWFLGLDNSQLPYYILGIAVSVCRSYCLSGGKRISLRTFALIAICVFTVLIRWQATAVVAVAIIVVSLFAERLLRHSRVFNIWTYSLITLGIFMLFVVLHGQRFFSFFIEGVLHKNLTFSGRSPIWATTISVFLKKPWFGWGVHNELFAWEYLGHSHAHNLILQILFEGGAIQLVAFLCLYVMTAKKLMKNKDHKIVMFLSVTLFSMMIANQMEPYRTGIWFAVYYLSFNSDKVIRACRENGKHTPIRRKDIYKEI